jgi:hypothetical protein
MSIDVHLPTLDGSPPWAIERVEYVALRNLRHVQLRVREHPGHRICEQLTSIASLLRLFNKTAASFLVDIEQFHIGVRKNGLLQRSRAADRRLLLEQIQERLYLFTSCSASLADQTRKLSQIVNISGYEERKNTTFAENPIHRFVNDLRIDVVHLQLHTPGWQHIIDKAQDSTTFFLSANQLPRASEYHSLSKRYLDQHPNGVDLGALVFAYRQLVNEFHTWMQVAIEHEHGEMVRNYHEVNRTIRALGFRVSWRLILSQVVIQAKRDPFQYLDRFLTASELQEVLGMSKRSRQQVDRIIQMIDEDCACDGELRALAYQAFGVNCDE